MPTFSTKTLSDVSEYLTIILTLQLYPIFWKIFSNAFQHFKTFLISVKMYFPDKQEFHMFHSEILASLNFNNNKILSPGLENKLTLKCCSSPSFWTLSPGLENNYTFKCWFCIFPTILTYNIMLENGQNKISVYGCSPIQGTKLKSCWNLMKPGSQSKTYSKKSALVSNSL